MNATKLKEISGFPELITKRLQKHGIYTASQFIAIANIHETHKALRKTLNLPESQIDQLIDLTRSCIPGNRGELAPMPLQNHMLGVYIEDSGLGLLNVTHVPTLNRNESLPNQISHISKLPAVRDQGKRGTCVAFAVVVAREFEQDPQKRLSEQFVYWACKQKDGHSGPGTYISTAMQCISDLGICLSKDWPYNPELIPGNEGQGPPPEIAERTASKQRIEKAYVFSSSDINTLKIILTSGVSGNPQLVIFGIPVFPSWQNAETYRTGIIVMPFQGESPLGGHALCLVGYEDDPDAPGGGYFIFRNSWSERWAADSPYAPGYGMLPYAYMVNYGRNAYAIEERANKLKAPFTMHAFKKHWKAALCTLVAGFVFSFGFFGALSSNKSSDEIPSNISPSFNKNTVYEAENIINHNEYSLQQLMFSDISDKKDKITETEFRERYDAIRLKLYESNQILFRY